MKQIGINEPSDFDHYNVYSVCTYHFYIINKIFEIIL